MDALEGADALILVTEWNEFRRPDFEAMKGILKQPVVFDGRNIYAPQDARAPGIHLLRHRLLAARARVLLAAPVRARFAGLELASLGSSTTRRPDLSVRTALDDVVSRVTFVLT